MLSAQRETLIKHKSDSLVSAAFDTVLPECWMEIQKDKSP